MTVDPATRRANRWLFVGLIVFAIGFCAAILLWMRVRTARKGGRVYPPISLVSPSYQHSLQSPSTFVFRPDFSPLHAL